MKNASLIAAVLMAAGASLNLPALPTIYKSTGVGPSAASPRRRQRPDNVEVRKLRAEQSAEIRAWNEAVEAKKQAKKYPRSET